jgi:hypothetical protein
MHLRSSARLPRLRLPAKTPPACSPGTSCRLGQREVTNRNVNINKKSISTANQLLLYYRVGDQIFVFNICIY